MNFNGACTLWFSSIGPWSWEKCCETHDLDYGHQIAKAIADAKLEHCVDAILPGMGFVMWVGVTVFGGLWYALARRRKTA
jgi:hypothetical protein